MECGKRVGKGVVTYPCYVEVESPGGGHAGPCAAHENDASLRQRRTWLDAEADRQRAVRAEQEAFPVQVVEPAPAPAEGAGIHRSVAMRVEGVGGDLPPDILAAGLAEPFEKRADRGGQPVPVHQPGSPSMHDLLVAEVEKRKSLGLSRYGTILQAHNGRNAPQDALDEGIDLCVYLMQWVQERQDMFWVLAQVADWMEEQGADLGLWVEKDVRFTMLVDRLKEWREIEAAEQGG